MAGRAPPKSKDKARRLFSARPLLTRDTAQAHPRARLLPSKAPFSLEGKERAGEEETVVPAKAGGKGWGRERLRAGLERILLPPPPPTGTKPLSAEGQGTVS